MLIVLIAYVGWLVKINYLNVMCFNQRHKLPVLMLIVPQQDGEEQGERIDSDILRRSVDAPRAAPEPVIALSDNDDDDPLAQLDGLLDVDSDTVNMEQRSYKENPQLSQIPCTSRNSGTYQETGSCDSSPFLPGIPQLDGGDDSESRNALKFICK